MGEIQLHSGYASPAAPAKQRVKVLEAPAKQRVKVLAAPAKPRVKVQSQGKAQNSKRLQATDPQTTHPERQETHRSGRQAAEGEAASDEKGAAS